MLFQSLSSWGFALSLPVIVLMYLLKRTYIDTPVSSNLLWRKALREQEANRPWQRLRRQLLLLLQLLAAALLVLALMDPVIAGRAAAGREVAVVLDVSASMAGTDGNGSLLEQAKEKLRRWLDETEGLARITLITAEEDPKVAAVGGPKAVKTALDGIRPDFGQTDLAAALTLADATLRGYASGEIIFVTDERTGEAQSTQTRLSRPLRLLTVPAVAGNVAIAAFGVREKGGGSARSAVVALINQGDRAVGGTLSIEAFGGKEAPQSAASQQSGQDVRTTAESSVLPGVGRTQFTADFRLEPGEQRTVRADLTEQAMYYRARIASGSADGYAVDDTAYAFGTAAGELRRVLFVGEGNLFLDKALKLAGVQTVQAAVGTFEPDEDTLKTIDWVLIDGDVRDADIASDAWRRLLAAKPVWRLHAAGSSSSATPASSEALVKEHPVVRYLTFQDVHIAKMASTDAAQTLGDAIVTYGGLPAIYAGVANGMPGIVFAFDLRDTDLPLRPEFPILVAQAASWMSGGLAADLGQAIAGKRINIQHRADSAKSEWVPIELLAGYEEARQSWPGATDDKGAPSGEQTAPAVPGLYRYVEYDSGGKASMSRLLAVVAGPQEGCAPVEGSDASGRASPTPAIGAENAGATEHLPLTPWIAAGLLLFIAAEWEVYRRGLAR